MRHRLRVAGLSLSLLMACGSPPNAHDPPVARPPAGVHVHHLDGRPPVAALARDGDPMAAVAMVVSTTEIAPDRGSAVPVALAAIVEARLIAALPGTKLDVIPDAEGLRARLLVRDAAAAARATDAFSHALLDPIPKGAALDLARAVHKKLAALQALPRPPAALTAASACEARPVPPASADEPTAATLEGWRGSASARERVAFGAVGAEAIAVAVTAALAKGPAWTAGTLAPRARPAIGEDLAIFDASGELRPGGARAVIVAQIDPQRVGAMARALGDPAGPLVARLRGLERDAALTQVSGTRHATRGCLTLELHLAADVHSPSGAATIARAVVITQREIELAGRAAPAEDSAEIAPDVRDGAEQIALATLSLGAPAGGGAELGPVAIGVAAPANAAVRTETDWSRVRDAIAKEKAALTAAWAQPAIDGRMRVELGQPESYVLLASPCGTASESDDDAGLSGLVAVAAARRARAAPGVDVEPWVAADAIGLIGHGATRPGESPAVSMRRIADAVARSFVVDGVVDVLGDLAGAQGALLGDTKPVLGVLAAALTPAHASWLVPAGTAASLLRVSSAQLTSRAEALRHGPLRAVVLANASEAQAREGLAAIDRWVARTTQPRECPAAAAAQPPKPGTYAIETDGPSEAYLAAPLEGEAVKSGTLLAAALDGDDGLLARALGGGLVRSSSVRVLGSPRAPALVIHLDAPGSALDAAVAQTRALLDKLQHGALGEADAARAMRRVADDATRDALDPRGRAIAAFRSDSAHGAGASASTGSAATLSALRAACATLKDSSLVIVAARPRGRRP